MTNVSYPKIISNTEMTSERTGNVIGTRNVKTGTQQINHQDISGTSSSVAQMGVGVPTGYLPTLAPVPSSGPLVQPKPYVPKTKTKARIPKLIILRSNPIVLGGLSSVSIKSKRLTAIDVFRGITILEVIIHHSSGMALRHLIPDTPAHEIVMAINRTLHFAVPGFVFLTSVVLTKSLMARFSAGRYFWRRLTRGVWPYVFWSGLYIFWYVWTQQRPAEILQNAQQWLFYLLNGKASYHLYFLLVAIEVYFILPLLLPLARYRPSIGQMLFVGFALQIGILYLNREYLRMSYPASTALWYVLPILVGVAVGSHLNNFTTWFTRYRWWLLGSLALVYPFYLFNSQAVLRGIESSPFFYHGLSWLYSILVALLLFGAAHEFQYNVHPFWERVKRFIAKLGMVSLQIYLIHPAILQALERIYLPVGDPVQTLTVISIYAVISLMLPAYLGWNLLSRPVSKFLFGR